jgi:hypothetical protein
MGGRGQTDGTRDCNLTTDSVDVGPLEVIGLLQNIFILQIHSVESSVVQLPGEKERRGR